jgi:uncharacterized protein
MADGIVMRVHRVRAEMVVAACDEELLGRDIPVGTAGRTVKVSSQFYGERRVSVEEFLLAARRATIVNLLGARVTEVAEREGMIAPGGCGYLGDVPHAEIFTIEG